MTDGFTPPTVEQAEAGDFGDLTDALVPEADAEEVVAAFEAGELTWEQAWHRLAEASAAIAGEYEEVEEVEEEQEEPSSS